MTVEAGTGEKEGSTLIRGGQVVVGQTVSLQDLLIRGERIAAMGELGGLIPKSGAGPGA